MDMVVLNVRLGVRKVFMNANGLPANDAAAKDLCLKIDQAYLDTGTPSGSTADGQVVPVTPHNLFVSMGQRESIVGFIGKDFEVYAVLSPLAFMPLIVDCLDRIIIWSKRKEPILFALDKSTW